MELDQILKLIDAGFTKADIEAMGRPAEVKPEEPVAEVPAEVPAEPVAAEPVKAQPDPAMNALLEEVKSLRKQLQMQAIMHDGFTPTDPDDAQKILASIINPANIEKKG